MRGTWIICRKELNSYFASPVAYVVMALFAFTFGFIFYISTLYFMQMSNDPQMGNRPLNMNEMIVPGVLSTMSIIVLFLLPLLAMRVFAEEKRSGTMELLITSPVTDNAIVVGKWLAVMILYTSVVLVGALSLLFLFLYGKPDWRPIAIGLLGLLLQGSALLSIGTFLSSTTKNQIIAGVAGIVLFFLLWAVGWGSEFDTSWFGQFRGYLSATKHTEAFAKGVLDFKDVVYYLSLTFLGLFLTSRSLESLRWRA